MLPNVGGEAAGGEIDRFVRHHYTDEIELVRALDLNRDNIARGWVFAAKLVREVGDTIDVGSLSVVATFEDELVLFRDAVYDDVGDVTDPRFVLFAADPALQRHQRFGALDLDVLFDLVREGRGDGVLFR